MTFSKSDLVLLRWSLAAVIASILLSSVILYGSGVYADSAKKERNAAQRQMNDARKRLNMARDDQENLAVFSREYDVLENNRIIGDDHRLDWIEGLEKLRDQNLVPSFSYGISPQKTYAPQPAISNGNFDMHYSEMKLQFELLHEAQLLDFLTALRSQIKGWYQLEGCAMKRTSMGEESVSASGTNITAECSGGWITLKNRNSQP